MIMIIIRILLLSINGFVAAYLSSNYGTKAAIFYIIGITAVMLYIAIGMM